MMDGRKEISRWQDNFCPYLTRLYPEEESEIPESKFDLDINVDTPTKEEITCSIKAMKSGKAGEKDGLSDMLKVELGKAPKLLMKISMRYHQVLGRPV